MRYVVPAVLLMVAAIHAVPLLGVLWPSRIASMYGTSITDPNLEILLRHRAVLFGLLAAFLGVAAFQPQLYRLALAAGLISVVSFVLVAWLVGGYNAALQKVVVADLLALVLLLGAAMVHWVRR